MLRSWLQGWTVVVITGAMGAASLGGCARGDAGDTDAAIVPVGGRDAGRDAGASDAGSVDAGIPDADSRDAGNDAGTIDAGSDGGSGPVDGGVRRTIFTATGADQTLVVPAGVTSIRVRAWGAGGGSCGAHAGGAGGFVSHDALPVTPGESLTIIVGVAGSCMVGVNRRSYGGGGAGSNSTRSAWAGAGGGRSAIRRGASDVLTAGGGGGVGYPIGDTTGAGGSGCARAIVGSGAGLGAGRRGTESAGGAGGTGGTVSGTAGGAYQGGDGLPVGASGYSLATSAGGGGGFFGGGGGAWQSGTISGAGGGGSCLFPPSGASEGGAAGVPGGSSDTAWDANAGRSGVGASGAQSGRVVIDIL